jgi:gas vesicle structural protein
VAALQLRRRDGSDLMSDFAQRAQEVTLLDLLDRVIDHGVVLAGDVTLSVADVDLIYLGVRVLLAPVERLPELVSHAGQAEASEAIRG